MSGPTSSCRTAPAPGSSLAAPAALRRGLRPSGGCTITSPREVPAYAQTSLGVPVGLLARLRSGRVLHRGGYPHRARTRRLGGEIDEAVLLAAALVPSRPPWLVVSTCYRARHLDVEDLAATPVRQCRLGRPAVTRRDWVMRCAASPLVGRRATPTAQGTRSGLPILGQEEQVADQFLTRSSTTSDTSTSTCSARPQPVFGAAGRPRSAHRRRRSALARVSVLAGGPGTGKTTTVSRLLAALRDQDPRAASRWRRRPARRRRGSRRRSARRRPNCRRLTASGLVSCRPSHCIGCWAGVPGRAAGSGTTEPTGCPTRWSSLRSSMVSLTMMCRLLEALRPTDPAGPGR